MTAHTGHRAGHTSLRRPGLAWGAAGVAATAWAGGVGLVTGFLALSDASTSRLPFASPALGGIALVLFVAVPFTIVCGLAVQGDDQAEPLAALAGAMLVGWIVVQLAFLREVSVFHPLFVAVGVAFLVADWHGPDGLPRHRELPGSERDE